MKRGDLVTLAVGGDYGKPRPALVVQADAWSGLSSVTVLRLTSDLHDAPLLRIQVEPSPDNGLRQPSQIMIDRAVSAPVTRIGPVIGHLDAGTMQSVSRALASFLGLDAPQA
jgi:mRNA interferase MazF